MSLRLHKTKGLNPRLTYCPRCHGEGPEIILVGAHDGVYECTACGMMHIGKPKKGECAKCGSTVVFSRKLGENERLPGSLCKGCEEQIQVVRDGGIFFKCKDCGAIGAIKKNAELAKKVRERTGVEAPEPCGVEFNKGTCPVCS